MSAIRRLLFAFLLTFILGPAVANAQNCSDILRYGIWENYSVNSDNSRSDAFSNWACSNSSRSSGISAAYRDSGSAINGAFSSSRASRRCTGAEGQSSSSATFEQDWQTASQSIATAWSSCMNADGAKAYLIYSDNPQNFVIALQFRSGSNSEMRAKIRLLGTENITCTDSEAISGEWFTFSVSKSISCSRADVSQSVVFDVEFENYGGVSRELPGIAILSSEGILEQIEGGRVFVLRFESGELQNNWYGNEPVSAYVLVRKISPNACVYGEVASLQTHNDVMLYSAPNQKVSTCNLREGRMTLNGVFADSSDSAREYRINEIGQILRESADRSIIVGRLTVLE